MASDGTAKMAALPPSADSSANWTTASLPNSVQLLVIFLGMHTGGRICGMRFVLEAHRKTKRRAQLENLLLLLLRMAAVGLLAFAVARPFTGADSILAPLTESRRDLVLVIDSSASTGYRESVRSVHERIVERAYEYRVAPDSSASPVDLRLSARIIRCRELLRRARRPL